jgi:Na+-transporting methylmalonyl-CoA/oxaloacetate decarboxylase gamma subunit
METSVLVALQITAAGMGLVFGAIVLLWIVMAVLVRLTSKDVPLAGVLESTDQRKRKAAAAAIAIALAIQADLEPHEFPLPPTAVVSAWQGVMRSNIFNKRGRVR